jgi:uncharacterized protein YjbI with pentapeptide repeats
MASEEQLALLRSGTRRWNEWRADNRGAAIDLSEAYLSNLFLPEVNLDGAFLPRADLSGANLSGASLTRAVLTGADLSKANLSKASLDGAHLEEARVAGTNLFAATLRHASLPRADLTEATINGAELSHADLSGADLRWTELSAADLGEAVLMEANLLEANLTKANLSRSRLFGANLGEANLRGADLSESDLRGADLRGADLRGADLSGADLFGADLSYTICAGSNFSRTTLTSCRIYAMSSWDMTTDDAVQRSLRITLPDDPEIWVDELPVAQFVAQWLASGTLSSVISTGSTRLVLILGRFAGRRQALLEALADDLRSRRYLPIYQEVDHYPPSSDQTAAFGKLARLSALVLADLSGARELWQMLTATTLQFPSIVCQPFIQGAEPAPIEDSQTASGLLALHRYRDAGDLLSVARALAGRLIPNHEPGEA